MYNSILSQEELKVLASEKEVPLSDTRNFGILKQECLIFSMAMKELEVDNMCTSIHLLWVSMIMRNIHPMKSPEKSIWILNQGLEGHCQEWTDARGGLC